VLIGTTQLAQERMIFSDLEWPFQAPRATCIPAVAELLVYSFHTV